MFCFTSRNSNAIRAVRAAAAEQHPPSQGRSLLASCQAGPGNIHCDCAAAGPSQHRPGAQEYPSSGVLLQPPLCGRRQAFHPWQHRKIKLSSFVLRVWKSGAMESSTAVNSVSAELSDALECFNKLAWQKIT